MFDNPVRQPVLVGIRGGMAKVYEKFKHGKCNATVLRTAFYNKRLNSRQRKDMRILYTTPDFPAQTLTASKNISHAEVARLTREISDGDARLFAEPIVKQFTGKVQDFIPASNSDYQTQRLLLEGVIYGW